MFFLPGLVGFLLMLTAEAKVGNSSDVPFCFETKECLLYDLLCETDDYEVRHYKPVKWVATDEPSYFMDWAMMTSFRRLFKYITGKNEDGSKIEMTTPVLLRVKEKKFMERVTYTMSFLLPSDYQENPPTPNDDKVYFHETPDMLVYVKTYGGWMNELLDKKYAKSLSNILDTLDAKYTNTVHYAAGYNSPMTLFNRHNEVWFVAEDVNVCPGDGLV